MMNNTLSCFKTVEWSISCARKLSSLLAIQLDAPGVGSSGQHCPVFLFLLLLQVDRFSNSIPPCGSTKVFSGSPDRQLGHRAVSVRMNSKGPRLSSTSARIQSN